MRRSPWLRNLFDVALSRKDRRRLSARNRQPVRLFLESLEDRLTPSAPTQTAGSYSDLVSAVAADTATNTNYVIQITGSFTFNSGGQVNISKLGAGSTLTIEGQGGSNFTLMGNGNRLFDIGSGQNVTFADLILTGGGGVSFGGAIDDQGGNVTLSKVAVQGNSVSGTNVQGGGIFVSQGGNLTVQGGSTIQSNRAVGTGGDGNFAQGGGLAVNCLNGASTIVVSDSTISNNSARGGPGANATTAGAAGGRGGEADGGGVFITGSGWNATFKGDTFAGNTAIGGNGGSGAAGNNAVAANTTGGAGGTGGNGGNGIAGAGYFIASAFSGTAIGTLTILNDSANPSTMIDNTAHGGSAGSGGAGGTSTGSANNSDGGSGGTAFNAIGGALDVASSESGSVTAAIGNTTFYGNKIIGGSGGSGGGAGTGGSGTAGNAGNSSLPGSASGGAVALDGNVTMVNSTVANNTVSGGNFAGSFTRGGGSGGGVYESGNGTILLDNNTITQNTVNGASNSGAGIYIVSGNPTLVNNLIQANQSVGSSAPDLQVNALDPTPLSNATDNFIGSMSANAVNTTTNIVGNSQTQLNGVAGVDSHGNPSGGPIYYPLLSGVVSIGAGSTGVLDTIGGVEGTSSANVTDEIGNPRSTSGSIDLGAVQYQNLTAPSITGNPSSQTVTAGANVTFTASASGFPAPTVQWQVSTDGGKSFLNISGATSGTLALGIATSDMDGNEYQAVFTNSVGAVTTSAATLTVHFAPTQLKHPVDQTATAGQNVTFKASASGDPQPTVQWQVSTDGGKTFNDLSGATSTTLTLTNVSTTMSGYQYRAAFTNTFGSATTMAATLTVLVSNVPPSITGNPSSQTVTEGQTASFTASANGTPSPTVQWQVSSDAGKTFTNISGATSTTLTLNNVGTAQNGDEYRAVFSNSAGSATSNAASLTVSIPSPPPPPPPPAPPGPPTLKVPSLLALIDGLLGATETVNANGTETLTDSFFGIPLFVSTFDHSGNLETVTLFGINVTFLFA